ncbi:MAG: small multi-drug export protein [Methanosarcinales archaeon]|nr:small multi-drug export protein [ANME-2 cluster archaeon]MDF1531117.1 small multi-drug export protein [ANME-2 cluster archaeon]MDW7775686.1 small multi-drug export protein [Methanosarcinales archaeon]
MSIEKTESDRFLIGLFITGLISVSIILFIFFQFGLIREFSLVFSTQFLSGREFAMLNGASMEMSLFVMILVSFISDIGSLMIGLPIFVIFHEELKQFPLMAPFMNFSEMITSNKSGLMHKFGLVGIFMICFIPFQMTGGLATACFAKLLGFTVREIIPVIAIASLIASVFWAVTADTVMKYLGPVQDYIPSFIVLVVASILIYNFVHYRNR